MLQSFLLLLTFTFFSFARAAASKARSALEPLTSKHYTWPNIPFQVAGENAGPRGPQYGYNLCNETTQNQDSRCQTAFVNDLTDFCTWSSGQTQDTISKSEQREVAWCTKTGHGTRMIPDGAITGAQWLYAKNYVQVVGYIDQTKVNLVPDDFGGELDPHGDDEQGNPLGGLMYSNAFSMNAASFKSQLSAKKSGAQNYTQVIEWVNFIGNGIFCLKLCNPSDPNAALLCAHRYDEIGCTYNAIADYSKINGTFEVCDSDDMAPPGIFTDNTGHLTTWYQPFTGEFQVPYQTTIPKSSNCQTFASSDVFALATQPASATTTSSGAGATGNTNGQTANSGAKTSTSTSSRTSSGTGGPAPTSGAVKSSGMAGLAIVVVVSIWSIIL